MNIKTILCTMSIAGLSLSSYAEEADNSLVRAEATRDTPSLSNADKTFLEGRAAHKNKAYEKAIEYYAKALSQLPSGPISASRRRSIKSHWADARKASSSIKKKAK